jgi:hypothetical protein
MLAAAAVVAITAVLVAGGGGASGTAVAAKAGDEGPRAILEKAMAADSDVTSATADFKVTLTADLDPDAEAPAQAKVVLDKPIAVTGTVAVDSDPFMGSMTVDVSLGGGGYSTETAMRWKGDEAWMKIMGAWYEAPPEAKEKLAEAQAKMATERPEVCPLEGSGIDPWAWVTGLELKGTQDVGGTEAYRIAGGLDVQALIDDMVAFIATPQFEELMKEHAPAEAIEEFEATDRAEVEEAAEQAADVVRDVQGEVWIAVDTYRVMKVAGSVTVVPPAEADADWLRSMDVAATITYGGFDEPVDVQAPEGARSWEDLQKLGGGACEAPMLAD